MAIYYKLITVVSAIQFKKKEKRKKKDNCDDSEDV